MELKKCNRCGCFYISENAVCSNCEPKDNLEISKLNNYIENNGTNYSLDELSVSTGVSLKNLNRFINNKEININFNLK